MRGLRILDMTKRFQVQDLPIEFIAETDGLLVVNKPPSMPVHACGQYAIHTVLAQLRLHYGKTGLRGELFFKYIENAGHAEQ